MAKLIEVKKTIPVPPPIEYITLQLSSKEAETLQIIFSVIGGDPTFTRRSHTDAISKELTLAGVAVPHPVRQHFAFAQNKLWFAD